MRTNFPLPRADDLFNDMYVYIYRAYAFIATTLLYGGVALSLASQKSDNRLGSRKSLNKIITGSVTNYTLRYFPDGCIRSACIQFVDCASKSATNHSFPIFVLKFLSETLKWRKCSPILQKYLRVNTSWMLSRWLTIDGVMCRRLKASDRLKYRAPYIIRYMLTCLCVCMYRSRGQTGPVDRMGMAFHCCKVD